MSEKLLKSLGYLKINLELSQSAFVLGNKESFPCLLDQYLHFEGTAFHMKNQHPKQWGNSQ